MENIEKTYALTDIQSGILFEISGSNYISSAYVAQMLFTIEDTINIPIILKAFSTILERHEVLRSAITFNPQLQSFVQSVYNKVDAPYVFHDYTAIEANKKIANLNFFLKEDINKPFDLAKPPLMRLAFLKFDDKKYYLVWTGHHILMGGASFKVLADEWFTTYTNLLANKPSTLPEPIAYQKIYDLEKKLSLNSNKQFWQKYLKNLTHAISLPASLKTGTTKQIETIFSEFNEEVYSKLRKFVDNHNLTINTLIEGAWGIVLWHYTGKQNVVFGSVRAYPNKEFNESIGLFINTLPTILYLNPLNKVKNYLKNIRRRNKILKQHIVTPLSKIKEWFHLAPEMFLYQSIVDYKPYSLNTLIKGFFKNGDCHVSLNQNIPYPLTLEVIKEKNFLKINLHYDTSLFEKDYAHSILLYFKQTLQELMECQEKTTLAAISTLPITDLKLIHAWNNTQRDYPNNKTVHQLFEQQVEKTPLAKALIYNNDSLSYLELNKRANQLAHHLMQDNITIETAVAICLKSNLNMIVAVLAILKSGGAYIPIDPNYPSKRIKYLLANSQAKFIISDSENIDLLNQAADNQVGINFSIINIDTFNFSNYPITNPNIPVQANNLMYIIYTSGSTGKPKGVMVEHQSALNMILSCIWQFKINQNSRVLQISSFSFDVSVAEWGMALLSGASLYLIDKSIFSPENIVMALKNYKISEIFLSTSILATLPKTELPDLKMIAFGGEPCSEYIVNFWAENRLFFNAYGITEATVCSTAAKYTSLQKNMSIIGTPLSNSQIYILDKNQALLPIGVPGEIHIGGAGVARGYLNNPEMTANKFIYKTFDKKNTGEQYKIYRTGDIGRWLSSGQLEFLGRIDEQIKIRGFRVELTEIERTLEKHPLISKAIVVVSQYDNDKFLYAYILGKIESIDLREIKKFIQAQLPNYMIPAKFYQINQFPLTPNGKIDKKKLLSLQIDQPYTIDLEGYNKSSALEKNIIAVIKNILPVDKISIHKNFFDIGFDSIKLVYFSIKLTEKLGIKIDVLKLFLHPTVHNLSNYITSATDENKAIDISKEHNTTQHTPKKNRVIFIDEQ